MWWRLGKHATEGAMERARMLFFWWFHSGNKVYGGLSVDETPEGFLLVEMGTENDHDERWRHYCYVIEGGTLVCIVPLMFDEYFTWPSMPSGWAIPF